MADAENRTFRNGESFTITHVITDGGWHELSEPVPVSGLEPSPGARTVTIGGPLCRHCRYPVRRLRPDEGIDLGEFQWTHEDYGLLCPMDRPHAEPEDGSDG